LGRNEESVELRSEKQKFEIYVFASLFPWAKMLVENQDFAEPEI